MRATCLMLCCVALSLQAAPQPIASGFGVVWSLLPLDDHNVLVAERAGKLTLLNISSGRRQAIAGLPEIHAQGQGGLMDLALLTTAAKPNTTAKLWLYFTFSQPHPQGAATALARARLDLTGLTLINLQRLLISDSVSDSNRHFGSRIALTDQHVFFSIGDRGERANGQRLDTHAGKILRLNLDGSIPPDNPFVANPKALDEIWSYGHRNPQGLVYDSQQQTLWSIEHGPRGGDELNRIEKAGNYGWARVSFGKEYWNPSYVGEYRQHPDMLDPVYSFTPSIAPGSLLLWHSSNERTLLLSGALKLRHLNQLTVEHESSSVTEQRWLETLELRIRALAKHPSGDLLFASDEGILYRWQLPSNKLPLTSHNGDSEHSLR